MIASTPSQEPHDVQAPSARLEDAIREIVRAEIQQPTQPTVQPTKPRLSDAFWLLIIVTNTALLIAVIPEVVLQDSKLALFVKLVPWLGGSLFVLGYAWFSDQILNLTRRPIFKFSLMILLLVLIPVSISQLEVFSVRPLIEPKNAQLWVDGKAANLDDNDWVRLSLQSHDISIIDQTDNENGEPNKRKFYLTYSEVFHAWRDSDYRPHWALIYSVPINAKFANELEIRKDDSNFDSLFWSKPPPTYSGEEVRRGAMQNTLLFTCDKGTFALPLPYGTYTLTSHKTGCDKVEKQIVTVKPGVEQVELREPCGTL